MFSGRWLLYPAAQFPLTDPPLSVHSVDVKHVPFLAFDLKKMEFGILPILTEILTEILVNKTNYPVVLWLAHPEFGKETMLNNENTKRDRYIRVRWIWPHKSAI